MNDTCSKCVTTIHHQYSWKNECNSINNKNVNENLIHENNHKSHGTIDLIMKAIASNINSLVCM